MKIVPVLIFMLMGSFGLAAQHAASPANLFEAGNLAYKTGEYGAAVAAYSDSARLAPASGTFQNLGLAEWQRGQVGPAILAWELANEPRCDRDTLVDWVREMSGWVKSGLLPFVSRS